MKATLRSLALFIFFISSFANALQFDSERIETELSKLKQQYKLPSLSLAIGYENEIVFAEAVGFADIANAKLATPKTQYSVASVAKPMTGILMAKLSDEGVLDLNSPASKYLEKPDFNASFSLVELASHLSGIPHDTPLRQSAELNANKQFGSPKDAFYIFDALKLLFSPGTQFGYSSNGYILLSGVIESAEGKPFIEIISSKLWQVFGALQTELDDGKKPNEATYYRRYISDDDYEYDDIDRNRSFLFGAGGFLSTPSDLIKIAQATYDKSYLSQQSKERLFTPTRLRDGTINAQNYALGWHIGELGSNDANGEYLTAEHSGLMLGAATAYLFVVPQCKASIAFATNTVPEKYWQLNRKVKQILTRSIQFEQCSD
jgi:CubicO group peptidase (beta-lactamase class C family)